MGRIWTLAAALMVAGAVSAIGNTYTWDGTTNNWNTTNHWIGSVLPSAGDTGIVNSGVAQMNAALTGSPTIVVNAGGTAVATASIAVTNLVLNGGKLRINGYGVVLGGTLNVQTDSWFQFESGGSQGYKGLLSGAGGVSITNTGGSTMNGGNYFSNNSSTGYTGNVHIYGSSGFHVRLDNSWALGSNNTVYVESNGTLAVNNANISRPVTLNGGTLAWLRTATFTAR